jgi:[ribosomal protein S18]-alanine N-acetyltransferase
MMEKGTAEKTTESRDVLEIIRGMHVDDIDQIMEIEKRSFVTPWSRRMFEETVFSPTSKGLVVKRENGIIGYIIFYVADVEAHIMNLAVNPTERKQGRADQLLTHALMFFKERNISECYLEVREHNGDAQRLYRRFGFETIGRRKGYYAETGEDALVMQLFL